MDMNRTCHCYNILDYFASTISSHNNYNNTFTNITNDSSI